MLERREVEQVLSTLRGEARGLREDARFARLFESGSAALRLTRVVSYAHEWAGPGAIGLASRQALALALRDAWATYEDRADPAAVDDAAVADGVVAVVDDVMVPTDPAEAPTLALAAVGDALAAYHGGLQLGVAERARETVQRRVAVALAYAVWMIRSG